VSALFARELTPPGRGAVAVVEVRGEGALDTVRNLVPGVALRPGDLRLAVLQLSGEALDQALIVVHAPERVEVHLHGSPWIVARLLAHLAPLASAAGPVGLEERARELLASAPCDAAARILLDQSEGALSAELERLCALPADEQRAGIEHLLDAALVARRALQPTRVLLCGPVNAGKSTLFNALHGAERVLVSAEPGTTRDVIVERVQLGAWPVDLWDAPGQRAEPVPSTPGIELERAGLRVAAELAARADVLLWLAPLGDPSAPRPPSGDARLLVIESRADLLSTFERRRHASAISALRSPQEAVLEVARRFRAHLRLPIDPWRPRAAVPFEELQIAGLQDALELAPRERTERLQLLLEPSGGTAPRAARPH
jgi:tRNA modification GTPase